jgi:hypothetical protein
VREKRKPLFTSPKPNLRKFSRRRILEAEGKVGVAHVRISLAPTDTAAKFIPNLIAGIFAIEFSTALDVNSLLYAKAPFALAVFHPQRIDCL